MTTLQVILASLCAVLAGVTVVAMVRDALFGRVVLVLVGVIEVGLLIHFVLGIVRLPGDRGDVSVATYVGYLAGLLLVLPAAVLWSASERSRSGTAVVLFGALVVPFLLLRTHDIWAAGQLG